MATSPALRVRITASSSTQRAGRRRPLRSIPRGHRHYPGREAAAQAAGYFGDLAFTLTRAGDGATLSTSDFLSNVARRLFRGGHFQRRFAGDPTGTVAADDEGGAGR